MPRVFFSYCHADEDLRDQLEKQLALLKRQGVIKTWHDRRIGAGDILDHAISAQLESSEIILLLVSSDFLASNYCYDVEMKRAMERHAAGDAVVIPVILRSCLWHGAPFGRLMATPTDGKPVTQWPDRDLAFTEVAKAIREAALQFARRSVPVAAHVPTSPRQASPVGALTRSPRSSNLRVARPFTERDKDHFKQETFEYIAAYFANSLDALAGRNHGIEGDFRRIDANRFIAVLYRDGKAIARCTVFMGGGFFGDGIAYSASETTASNSCNETLYVDADEQTLFLTCMSMTRFTGHGGRASKLSQEGAAELYWSMLIEPLQRGDFF